MKLYYFKIKARNLAAVAIAQAAGVELEQIVSFDLASLKASLPFGQVYYYVILQLCTNVIYCYLYDSSQVPYLVDGDVSLAQSGAIQRYIAKKGNLLGDNDKDYAMSEMLTEESADILNMVVKCQRSADKVVAYNALMDDPASDL